MPFYLYEIRDSDGNDCIVYDCIVEAADLDSAEDRIFEHFDAFTTLDTDGDRGYYRECDCAIPPTEIDTWECSHGGISISAPEVYETEDAAITACVYYHSRYSI